jgi:hypothetical protein
MTKRASPDWPALFVLKKHQTDQSNDRDPGDCVGDNKAVPELAAARIVLFKHKAVCIFSDHRRLPGKLFQDKRFVSCLCFDLPKLCDRRRARDASRNQLRRKNNEMSLSGDYAWQHPDARSTIGMQSELSVFRQKQFVTLHK